MQAIRDEQDGSTGENKPVWRHWKAWETDLMLREESAVENSGG